MTQTTYTDSVVVQGSRDTPQVVVQGNVTQTQPLQNWQDNTGNVKAQVTSDGRLQIGNNLGAGAPKDALIQANNDITLPSAAPLSGWHTLGRITGALSTAVNWVVHELQLLGSGGVSTLEVALRSKLTLNNSGNNTSAELRAADLQVINQSGSSSLIVNKATGLRATVSNASNAYLSTAIAVEAALTNDTSGSIAQAVAFSVVPPINNGTLSTLTGLNVPDLTQGTVANYALYTGKGVAHLGDVLETPILAAAPAGNPPASFVRLYTKLNGSIPQLYALNSAGIESSLSGIGSAGSFSSVAINQPSPAAKLHVKDSVSPQAIIESTSAATTWLEFRDGNASQHRMVLAMGLGTTTDGKFGIYDAVKGAQRLSVDTNGQVGINQITPSAMLEVDSNAAATTGLIVRGASSQAANLQEWQTSSGAFLAAVDAAGRMYNTASVTILKNSAAALNFSNIDSTETDINWSINNNLRWQVYVYGSGASSNWSVRAFSASGAYLGTWLSIDNTTGTASFGGSVSVSGTTKTTGIIDNSNVLVASSINPNLSIAYSTGSSSHAGNIIITTNAVCNSASIANFTMPTSFVNKPGVTISTIGPNTYGVYIAALFPGYFQLFSPTTIPAGQTITISYVIMGATA